MFDGSLALEALDAVARAGGIMLVHCEDGHTIRWLDATGRRALGRRSDILDYLAARPEDLEAVSVAQVGLWAAATRCPLHLVHLSTAQGMRAAQALRARGQDVSLETCPQYLELESADLGRLGPLAKFAPVLRPPEHREAIWAALRAGEVTIVGTDHSGHQAEAKRRIGEERGIFDVPFGMPGLETLLPLLYTAGIVEGRLTHVQLADVLAANAARRFGWYPWKGSIRVGSSADLTLVDPGETRAVSAAELRTNAGYSPWEGRELRGWPSATVLRGEVVCEGRQVLATPGRFLPTAHGAQRRGRQMEVV
jgi:dihydroorotase-like cyclic amidohydrolase